MSEGGARFNATVASVRRALERTFHGVDTEEGVWRGHAGPTRAEVLVDVVPYEAGAGVHVWAPVLPSAELTPALARALLVENEPLVFGRLRHADGRVVVEQLLLGGHTLHVDEVRVAVWAMGWAAGTFGPRLEQHLTGATTGASLPAVEVAPRRGAAERIASTEERVERFLRERYGGFERDEQWGYHGGFGSARVFCSVSHYLEVSTAVLVASPVLSSVALDDALALDAYRAMAARPLARLAWVEARSELWAEHAVLGDDLDPRELEAAIDAVAELADGEDDRLQAAHGGRRYADLVDS